MQIFALENFLENTQKFNDGGARINTGHLLPMNNSCLKYHSQTFKVFKILRGTHELYRVLHSIQRCFDLKIIRGSLLFITINPYMKYSVNETWSH
jgi:hypothetical protein